MRFNTGQRGNVSQVSTIFALIVFTLVQLSMAQEHGSLRGVAINRTGDRLPNANVELFANDSFECKYSGKTDATGAFQINDIPEGVYLLDIKVVGMPTLSINNIRIEGGRERDLGYRTVGPENVDCFQPGVHCQISVARPAQLPCAEGLILLRAPDNVPIIVENEELRRRAIEIREPKWPEGAKHGYALSVQVVIGTDGSVLCADTFYRDHPTEQAAIAAARKWRFQPILNNAIPISAFGTLEFRVP